MATSTVDSPQLFDLPSGPDFEAEKAQQNRGRLYVCGVDEAGRGPLAGPVTAAAVILDPNNIPAELNDSKKLNEAKRAALFELILAGSKVSFAHVGATTIDRLNIREASLLAMKMAVDGLPIPADHALIDGNAIPNRLPCPASALVKGDARSMSIAAASIVAKVMRDRLMLRMEALYPGYGLGGHKGYPTKAHRDAVMQLGPCPIHRKSFAPVAAAIERAANKKPAS